MRSVSFVVVWVVVFGLLLGLGVSVRDIWVDQEAPSSAIPYETYNYDRLDEVKKDCKSVLSSASELLVQSDRIFTMREELTFESGDWSQLEGKAPIMPFDGGRKDNQFRDDGNWLSAPAMGGDPSKLASFRVKDVSLEHRSKNWIGLAADLTLDIGSNGGFEGYSLDQEHMFRMWPGQSVLTIQFEGVYTKNEKERVLCMLGTTTLPDREVKDDSEPWKWVGESSPNSDSQPPLMQDDQILLVLRYPKTFNLTTRAVLGEMRSLNPESNDKYFDLINMISRMGVSAKYEFSSGKLVSRACNPYPYKNDSLLFSGISVYKENRFCDILEEITRDQFFTVMPNWKCSGNGTFCDKLGPFGINKEVNATDGGFNGVSLSMQVIKCLTPNGKRNGNSARVSAEFKAIPPSEYRFYALRRSGISNMTVSAEGIWNSTSGQLCMVGCVGLVDVEGNGCDSRICLYIPTSFSIRQRSVIFGTFSSVSTDAPAYFPLVIERLVSQTSELWNYFQTSRPVYTYTKFERAGAFFEKHEQFSFGTMIKKSLLEFPKLEDAQAFQVSLSLLAEDLTLQTVGRVKAPNRQPAQNIHLEILSVGPLFGRYWSNITSNSSERESPYHTKAQYSEKQLLLNVSAQFSLEQGYMKEFTNVSSLFLEGLYDQRVGKMYLLGCRDVRASWEVLSASDDLEDGLDCQIEVIVSYPPTSARWLADPTAKISISSQRNDDDPLRFSSIKFETYPISYRKNREELLSRRGIEGILRIVTLSLAIACIVSQLFHIKHSPDTIPYMSLVTLGVQAIGYALPLVTDAEALFKKTSAQTYRSSSYVLERNRWFHILDYAVKLLVMTSLLLTLRLCQKVWKSRSRLLSRSPHEPHRVPSDKKVLFSTVAIHVLGYILVLVLHNMGIGQKAVRQRVYSRRHSVRLSVWEAELEEYVGLVQDFYLLPQVIANVMWQLDSKPLRKLYYFGITVVRLLPHLYDRIRPVSDDVYFPEEYEFVDPNMDFFSKFGDVAIPITASILALLVYAQQRWSYEKLSHSLTFKGFRFLPRPSPMYERLPSSSKVLETELASSERERDQE